MRSVAELFVGMRHQDAHEFLNFLINEIVDVLQKDEKRCVTRAAAET